MSANEMTFGVEIETHLPINCPIHIGPHGNGTLIPQMPGWKADADPSIRCGRDRRPCEFVSPVYTGAQGLAQFVRDMEVLRSLGAKVNNSCGLHIHIGFNRNDSKTKAKLITLVANFEKAIFAATGTKNRERSRWCNPINNFQNVENVNGIQSRYHVLNLRSTKPTVEFRAFSGSTNTAKIIGYIRLCIAIVERAQRAKRVTNWTAKTPVETSPIARDGEGQTCLNRLFYQLGWTKGREDYVHGDLQGPGIPSIKRSKKDLMKLAKKYDSQR